MKTGQKNLDKEQVPLEAFIWWVTTEGVKGVVYGPKYKSHCRNFRSSLKNVSDDNA